MFIQDFYLGLDGKQRVIVLGAAGAFASLLLCSVFWIFSGNQSATNLSGQELIAITSGQTEAERSVKTAAAAALAAPTLRQIEIVHAGLIQGARPSAISMQSKARSQEALQAYRQAKTIEVKAALLPGFARRRDYDAIPLIVQAIHSDSLILSGRAIATAQHLLGVRYETSISQLRDPSFRNEIADMVMQDWQQLQQYPKFRENIGS
jgi:hypothetical protein